jgi:chitinase
MRPVENWRFRVASCPARALAFGLLVSACGTSNAPRTHASAGTGTAGGAGGHGSTRAGGAGGDGAKASGGARAGGGDSAGKSGANSSAGTTGGAAGGAGGSAGSANGGHAGAGTSGADAYGGVSSGLGGTAGAAGGDAGGAGENGGGAWVYGYWAVWQATQYPVEHIAWRDLTHAALSFIEPRAPASVSSESPYATLDSSNASQNLGKVGIAGFADAAHAGGTRPLISLGGAGAGAGFAAAASSANRARFIADIVAACNDWGYDGVDLDWEDSIVEDDFLSLVEELRAAAPPGFLLTVPVGAVNVNLGIDAATSALWSEGQKYVDQLNVMTYTGSGAYPGWAVWYLDPLLGEGSDHPFDVASSLAAWAQLGIAKSKLGVGVGFYGRAVSAPVTATLQAYGSATTYEDDTKLSYGNIVRYFERQGGATSSWDDTAKTTALSWPSEFHPAWTDQFPGDAGPATQFLTYEDVPTVQAKGSWVKANGYGGVIIWTINEGVQFPYGDDGYANPLLDATAAAFR